MENLSDIETRTKEALRDLSAVAGTEGTCFWALAVDIPALIRRVRELEALLKQQRNSTLQVMGQRDRAYYLYETACYNLGTTCEEFEADLAGEDE